MLKTPQLTMVQALKEEIEDEINNREEWIKILKQKGIESVLDNTLYSEKLKSDWYDSWLEHFYPDKNDKGFYSEFSIDYDVILLYKVMREIHYIYYETLGQIIPKKPRLKLKRSKNWKNRQKSIKKLKLLPKNIMI